MKAMTIVPDGGAGALVWADVPDPEPAAGELLVRVRASALNRADLAHRRGVYRQESAPKRDVDIAGLEFAGEVLGWGDGVSGFAIGDRVMGMYSGSYAERLTVHHRRAIPVPANLTWEEAATLPVTAITAHDALVTNGRLQAGETVLVHAASSGVGVAALQIAKALGATPVIGTSTSDEKLVALAPLRLDFGLNTRAQPFEEGVRWATQGHGADIIIDNVGASYLAGSLACLARGGRLVSVGRLGGGKGEIDLDALAAKRQAIIGVTFRIRTEAEIGDAAQAFARDVLPALADGRVRALVDRVFPVTEALAAQAYLASNTHIGKIALTVP